MFTIRPQQLQILERAATADFRQRMVAHVLEVFPDQLQDIPRSDLCSMVSQWIVEALHWHIVLETHVEQFVELCACHHELRNPKEVPWILDILSYPGRSPQNKLNRLKERLIFETS